MGFKAWFKDKTADKVLLPIRDKIADIVEPNSNVLEVGSGTGHLLFKLSKKVNSSVGIDIDQQMINFAENKRKKLGINNLQFFNSRIETLNTHTNINFDISTATLCLHEMKCHDALNTLKKMATISKQIIIADFTEPKTFGGKMGIEFDELISGHYSHFKSYGKMGYFPYISSQAELNITSTIETSIDGMNIWVVESNVFT